MASNNDPIPINSTTVNLPINPPKCLLDYPELWTKFKTIPKADGSGTEFLIDAILRSKRLMDLRTSPKNSITHLPTTSLITPHLTCSTCNEIPFPRKGSNTKPKNAEFLPHTIFQCSNGHPICRVCMRGFNTCMHEEPQPDGAILTAPYEIDDIPEGMSMSTTSWNKGKFCGQIINEYDFLLEDMIDNTEFRCSYYYDGCQFQGKGEELHDHEKGHVKGPEKDTSKQEREDCGQDNQANTDDDDAAILSYNNSEALADAETIIRKVMAKANSLQIELTNVPRTILEQQSKGAKSGRNRRF